MISKADGPVETTGSQRDVYFLVDSSLMHEVANYGRPLHAFQTNSPALLENTGKYRTRRKTSKTLFGKKSFAIVNNNADSEGWNLWASAVSTVGRLLEHAGSSELDPVSEIQWICSNETACVRTPSAAPSQSHKLWAPSHTASSLSLIDDPVTGVSRSQNYKLTNRQRLD